MLLNDSEKEASKKKNYMLALRLYIRFLVYKERLTPNESKAHQDSIDLISQGLVKEIKSATMSRISNEKGTYNTTVIGYHGNCSKMSVSKIMNDL